MTDATPAENSPGPATALAEPPQPPTTPPHTTGGSTPGRGPDPRRVGIIAAVVLGGLALALVALAVFLVVKTGTSGSAGPEESRAAYDSAMSKAGVSAPYPGAPVEITSVIPSGSHLFSATFTAEEIAALLNTFTYESDIAGLQISLSRVSVSSPAPGIARLAAAVSANGGTYSGDLTMPLTFASGHIESSGVTELTVEGLGTSDGQKSQVGDALLDYFNAYLDVAPGLSVESASITAEGVAVTGTAPDTLAFP